MAQNIIVPVDFSNVTDSVLAMAKRMARTLGAKLWLIHVGSPMPDFVGFEVGPPSVRTDVARELREEHRLLQERVEGLRKEGLEAEALLATGLPADKIVQEAERLNVDMIILGSHGHGALYHLLAGSVCQGVLKRAPCPVVIVPARAAVPAEV